MPFSGRQARATVAFGDGELTLVATPVHQLGGTLLEDLPFIVAGVGTLLTVTAAVLVEWLSRRRERAEQLAAENHRLYSEQQNIAETLQRALLPQHLPSIRGVEIDTRYRPGVDAIDVGGDWYDVIERDEDHFLFVIGDVSGRGLRAASVMGSLRYAIRAFASEGHDPQVILSRLCPLLDQGRDGHFATVLCGLVDVPGHTVSLATAGHLPPILIDGTNSAPVSVRADPPIGVVETADYAATVVEIPFGATLLAFTDGLVERRDEDLGEGLQRLCALSVHGDPSLTASLDWILSAAAAHESHDDTAIIGIRWVETPNSRPAAPVAVKADETS